MVRLDMSNRFVFHLLIRSYTILFDLFQLFVFFGVLTIHYKICIIISMELDTTHPLINHQVTMELDRVFGWLEHWINLSTWPIHHSHSKCGCMPKHCAMVLHVPIMPFSVNVNKTHWIVHFILLYDINGSILASMLMTFQEIRWANNKDILQNNWLLHIMYGYMR
jgi:hypothetical protein